MDVPPSACVPYNSRSLRTLLERVTQPLALELASPGTPFPRAWRKAEWAMARAVAVMQGIGPLLASRSGWPGEEWREFLVAQRTHVELRHERLAVTLQQIDCAAQAAGVGLVALKGMELHRLGVYLPGDRPMADIDLLVTSGDYDLAVALLERAGFKGTTQGWKDHLFVAPNAAPARGLGEHHANPVKIELHRHIVERLPWRITALPAHLIAAPARAGIQPYPSIGSLMLHLLLHAAGAMPTRTLRMIQLHDIGALAARMGANDWQIIVRAAAAGGAWWAYPPLRLTANFYGHSLPDGVLDELRIACPPRLARRTEQLGLFEVSHSYPWMEAFPGIGWARSWGECVEYMASRIRPDRATLAKRQTLAVSEAWSDPAWSQRSQWRRVLRFASGPRARPSTLHAVRLAFEEG